MLFSILVANYNNSRFLKQAIDSVFSQSFENWEIILVDDGSTDEFECVIRNYVDDRLKIFRNGRNRGCPYTKHRCLELASGDLAAFLDPDDALSPDALQVMVDEHTCRPHHSLIYSTHYVCDQGLLPQRISEKPRTLPLATPYLMVSDGSIHHFACFKLNAYRRTPGLQMDERYDRGVDQELYYLLEEEGQLHFINLPLYYYRIHTGSISNSGNEGRATICHYYIIEKSCRRRISKLEELHDETSKYWRRKYRTRLNKIRIFRNYRRKEWASFAFNLVRYPFNGGLPNLVNYVMKIPKEGVGLFKRSFVVNYRH